MALARHNLPSRPTTFVGRESERAELTELVRSTKLVTLTGAGGSGKTRLALEVATHLLDDFAGVWLVDLAPVDDPGAVPQRFAAVLGVREQADTGLAETIAEHLRRERSLIVLDNCEHLLQVCADLASELLSSCPDVRMLATSRQRLGLAAERVYVVEPLPFPPPGAPAPSATEYAAVRLFADRASIARPGFELDDRSGPAVAEICARLDGVPLAIELAAARVKVLGCAEIAARLRDHFGLLRADDLPGRHRTLQALIGWSYDLLDEDEQRLLRALSVFAGGCSLDALSAVTEIDELGLLDLLSSLIDKSLVTVTTSEGATTRYGMLETVRAFAAEKAAEAGDLHQLRARHARWFALLADEAREHLRGPQHQTWMTRLEGDADNLRRALDFFSEDPDGAGAEHRFASALMAFWDTTGLWTEGRERLTRALRRAPSDPRTHLQTLHGAAHLAAKAGDYGTARAANDRMLELARSAADDEWTGIALLSLATVDFKQGKAEDARARYVESLEIFGKLGLPGRTAAAQVGLGTIAQDRQHWTEAQSWYEQALVSVRQTQDARSEAIVLMNLASVHGWLGDMESARRDWEESLRIAGGLGDGPLKDRLSLTVGGLLARAGEPAASRSMFEKTLESARARDDEEAAVVSLEGSARAMWMLGETSAARASFAEALEMARRMRYAWTVTRALDGLARIAHAVGDAREAQSLYEQLLSEGRRTDDPAHATAALVGLARLRLDRGDTAGARQLLDEALATSHDEMASHAEVLIERANVARSTGELDSARRSAEGALAGAERLHDRRTAAEALVTIGAVAREDGRTAEAVRHQQRALESYRDIDEAARIAEPVEELAAAFVSEGRPDDGARLLGAAASLREKTGLRPRPLHQAVVDDTTRLARTALGPQGFEELVAEGRRMPVEDAMSRDRASDRSVFRREGDYWTLTHDGRSIRLKDGKGLRYIAHLVAHPGLEFHVLDLVGAVQGVPAAGRAGGGHADGLRPATESEDILDTRSRQAYLRRVEELRAEIEEAEAWSDEGRAARLGEELEFVLGQLAGGIGLGGRARKAVSDADRARWAVSKAVTRTISRIRAEHPDLGRHLADSVRTGTFCSYAPAEAVSWSQ